RMIEMIDLQINMAVDRFLDPDYGPATFAEFASKRLGVEFDASDFSRCDFDEAEKAAREKASRMVETQIHEALEENVSTDVDPKEWNWQALAGRVNNRYGLKTTDRDLKKIGRDNLAAHLAELAEKSLASVDLSGGKDYLKDDWGLR